MIGNIVCILMAVFILSLAGCNDSNTQVIFSNKPFPSEIELPSLMPECKSDYAVMKNTYSLVKVSEGDEIVRKSNVNLGFVLVRFSGGDVNFPLLINEYIKNKWAVCIENTNSISLPVLL